MLRDLLQPIKDNALKLKLIAGDVREQRQRTPVSRRDDQKAWIHKTHDLSNLIGSYSVSDEQIVQRSGSGLIIASTSTSLCALCGVALHLENPSEKSRQFTIDEEERSDDRNHHRSNTSKDLDNTLFKTAPYKADISVEMGKDNDNAFVRETVLDCSTSKGNKNHDIDISAKKKRKIISRVEAVDKSEEELKSKLLFVRRISSDKTYCQICQMDCQRRCDSGTQMMRSADNDCTLETPNKSLCGYNVNKASKSNKLIQQNSKTTYTSPVTSCMQDASTLTHEMFCPCACGLLLEDENEGELSIESLSILKEKLIKTKLEEFGFYRDSKEESIKTHSDIEKIRETKMQKWRREKSVESSVNEEIMQLKLHRIQAKELHRNIQFIKEENEYLRHFVEKCYGSSERTQILLQLLPIEATYSRFTAAIEFLRTRYRSGNGIIATLTDMLRGSINAQWITERLLAPFVQR